MAIAGTKNWCQHFFQVRGCLCFNFLLALSHTGVGSAQREQKGAIILILVYFVFTSSNLGNLASSVTVEWCMLVDHEAVLL